MEVVDLMNKPMVFAMLVGWIFVVTFLVNSVTTFDPETGITVAGALTTFGTEETGFFSLLQTLWSALTFQIEGLHLIFNLFFLIPTLAIGYMIIEFIRGN